MGGFFSIGFVHILELGVSLDDEPWSGMWMDGLIRCIVLDMGGVYIYHLLYLSVLHCRVGHLWRGSEDADVSVYGCLNGGTKGHKKGSIDGIYTL